MKLDKLTPLFEDSTVSMLRFADQVWIVDGIGALYWPARKVLVISDLHFGKGSYLKQFGSPLPTYDTPATLTLIETLLERYHPETVVSLGDSFHDLRANERLFSTEVTRINACVERVSQWYWILGNHDPDIPAEFTGSQMIHWVCEEILFTHEPESETVLEHLKTRYQIMGHFHPKASCRVKRQQMTGKCFVKSEAEMIMPSLGVYTGGLSIDDPVFATVFTDTPAQIVMCYELKAYLLPNPVLK